MEKSFLKILNKLLISPIFEEHYLHRLYEQSVIKVIPRNLSNVNSCIIIGNSTINAEGSRVARYFLNRREGRVNSKGDNYKKLP